MRVNRSFVGGAAMTALMIGGLVIGQPAHAQFGSLRETRDVDQNGFKPGTPGAVDRPLFVGFNPVTYFKITNNGRNTNGSTFTRETKSVAPLVVVEKQYKLENPTSFSLGTWYWRSSSSTDRYGIYGKYFFDKRFGAQATAGGDTHKGFIEYYAFALYNALRGSDKAPLSVQLGVGPYFPRKSEGDTGYTAIAQASYALKNNLSINASYWYVDYKSPLVKLGFTQHNSLARASLGIGYSF